MRPADLFLAALFLLLLAEIHVLSADASAPVDALLFYADGTAGSDANDNGCTAIESPCATLDHVFSMAAQVENGGDGVDIEIHVADTDKRYLVHNNATISPSARSFTVKAWRPREIGVHMWSIRDSREGALFTLDAAVHTKLQKFEMSGAEFVDVKAGGTNPMGVVQINGHMPQTRVLISGGTFNGCSMACISLRDGSVAELTVRDLMIYGRTGPGMILQLRDSNTAVNIEDCYFHMNHAAKNSGGGGLSVVVEPSQGEGRATHNNVINVRRTKFGYNQASFGGAFYARIANIPASGSPANLISVTDCTFMENHINYQESSPMGGAVFVDIDRSDHPAEISFERSDFNENYGPLRTAGLKDVNGGALAIRSYQSHRTSVVVEHCTFLRNGIHSGRGGAFYTEFNVTRDSSFDLRWTSFQQNGVENIYHDAANARGGALALVVIDSSGPSVKIDNANFEFNVVKSPNCIKGGSCGGGAIWAHVDTFLEPGSSIKNSQFKQNTVDGKGLACSVLHREGQAVTTLVFDRESCAFDDNKSKETCNDPDVSCFGKGRNEKEVCSGQGVCGDYDQCLCNQNWGNPQCDLLLCERGKYLNATECVECPEGTYDNRDDEPGSLTCAFCPPGSYSQARGAYSSDTCEPCDSGTISSEPGASECEACGAFQIANDDQTGCIAGGVTMWLAVVAVAGCAALLSMCAITVFLVVSFVVRRLRRSPTDNEELQPLAVQYS